MFVLSSYSYTQKELAHEQLQRSWTRLTHYASPNLAQEPTANTFKIAECCNCGLWYKEDDGNNFCW